ncbi:MAG: zinc ribbon domain-containing protein [Candidatus Gastranaerophilaceae bacterium]
MKNSIIDVELFNSVQKLFNQSKARSHDTEFLYTGLIHCGHCGCQMTAELKKGKYVYYHCTGKRGGDCTRDWIREEQLDEVFTDLIRKIPNPDNGLFDLIRKGIKEARRLKGEYEESSVENIQKQINRLQARIDNLYTDKLDEKISQEFWKEKHNKWYEEKEELIQKLSSINKADRTFDEGTKILENFCKHAPQAY